METNERQKQSTDTTISNNVVSFACFLNIILFDNTYKHIKKTQMVRDHTQKNQRIEKKTCYVGCESIKEKAKAKYIANAMQ